MLKKKPNTKKVTKSAPKKEKYPTHAVERMIAQLKANKRQKDILKDFENDCAK